MPAIDIAAVAALRAELTGAVTLRGERGATEALSGSNLLSPLDPDLVIEAATEADVQAGVRFAAVHSLEVVALSTGHGSSRVVDSGVVIRTSRLAGIAVDAAHGTATIGAGARWRDVQPVLHEHGLVAVAGSSPHVGVVGLLLGGGTGPVSRTLGWAADRALSFRVVNADGDVIVASADEHPDLFWALKGGKVGVGIVTEVTIAAVALSEVHGGGLFFAEEDIEPVLRAWLPWARSLPDAGNTSCAILRMPPEAPGPLSGATVLHLRWAYVDPDATTAELTERGEALLSSVRAVAPTLIDAVGILPADRLGEIHAEPNEPMPIWEHGEFLDDIDDDYLDVILAAIGPGVDSPFTVIETRYLGGAMREAPASPSAIGGRDAGFSFLVVGIDIAGVTDAALRERGAALVAAVQPYVSAEVNANWVGDLTGEQWPRLWSPATAARLAEIRSSVDPERRFAF